LTSSDRFGNRANEQTALATPYFVGARLTRFQASVVSFLFVFGTTMLTVGLYGTMQRSIALVDQIRSNPRLGAGR
jgi:hypothetical protein